VSWSGVAAGPPSRIRTARLTPVLAYAQARKRSIRPSRWRDSDERVADESRLPTDETVDASVMAAGAAPPAPAPLSTSSGGGVEDHELDSHTCECPVFQRATVRTAIRPAVEQAYMSELDPGDLFPNERTLQAVADGDVTQIHRGNRYAEAGDTFDLDGDTFEVVDVTERTLGDMTDEDARREGSADLEAYKERMVRAHGGDFTWNEAADVVRHRVARVDQ
jgi:hypothetical protein